MGRTRASAHLAGAVAIMILGPLGACASDDDSGETSSAGTAPAGAASTDPGADKNEFAGSVAIGGGRQLYLRCLGAGSPTVLFEAGDESDSNSWSQVQNEIATNTRTCAYDRAGTGSSDPATGCRKLTDILDDLEALLGAADVEPPYVLVGESGGGFLMAGFAARRPHDVSGLVLLETPKAITIMPPGLKEEISCANPENVEHRDYYAVEHAAWDNRKRLGDFPVRIVSNDYGTAAPEGDEQTNVKDQRGWLELSPDSKQVVVTSGHEVAYNEYPLAIRLIREVLAEAR
ncbi:alpha/beta hydrolase [Nocardioides guangzhouensis]|uniref:Alpha/beta hydrolase n=1 Tax=Nocardioides guangzhouensis TaxID=2497878 RepID=A0A4Q4Z1N4_9ACTN|nr:alpha/beta hydrolase [Nocardioides guangzhouensis]RYP80786.1 alpha/beta hydrolase [Nocardioides guangzhouensis]